MKCMMSELELFHFMSMVHVFVDSVLAVLPSSYIVRIIIVIFQVPPPRISFSTYRHKAAHHFFISIIKSSLLPRGHNS